MTPKQVLALLTQEQVEDILTECCYFFEAPRVATALIRGLSNEEIKLVCSILATHVSFGDDEFDLPQSQDGRSS